MTGLFFPFDTTSWFYFSQLSFIIFLILIFKNYWVFYNRFTTFYSNLLSTLSKEFLPLMGNNYQKGSIIFFLSLFSIILLNNFQGLLSYTFTWTSHIMITLIIGLPIWMSSLLMGLTNNLNKNLSHLTPTGTPIALMSFMVLIESLSILIRPITLSVRLAANITAGHLLLSLIAWSHAFYALNFVIQVLMFILEIMVAFIQAYVFSMLSILYMEESN